MFRGDTLQFGVVVYAPTQFPSSQLGYCTRCCEAPPQNLSGWFVWCTLKKYLPNPDLLAVAQVTSQPASFPLGGGILVAAPLLGQAHVTIPPAATQGFPDSDVLLEYDVQTQDPSGNIFTVERGTVVVEPDVTNATTAFGPINPAPPMRPIPVVNGASSPWPVGQQDALVEFDGSDGLQGRAALPVNPSNNELHTFVQTKWTNSTPPPVIDANGRLLQPYGQGQPSGARAASTAITDFGGRVVYQWDGAAWVVVG